jgi:C1A family cysteine protease
MKKMYSLLLGLSFILNLSAAQAFAEQTTNTQVDVHKHHLGLLPPSEERIKSFPKAPTITSFKTLPSAVDLSANFPSPGDQGQQGSCVAWATAYDYKTFQEKLENRWNITTTDHQFSPAYVYNQINGGQDGGAYIDAALNLIKNQGVASLAVFPYHDNNYTTQPNSNQRQAAAPYKALSWGALAKGDVNGIKNHLAAGDGVVVGIPVYPDFDQISPSNPVYDNTNGVLRGWHAISLVGYDNSKNAFKFINSWGTNWGLNGYGYISYNLVQKLGTIGYVMADAPDR